MKLNSNGILTRFYKRAYGLTDSECTSNFCNFFWAIIFALLLMPLNWWTYFCEQSAIVQGPAAESMMGKRCIAGLVGIFGAFVVVLLVTGIGSGFYWHPWIASSIAAVIAMIIFVVWLLFRDTPGENKAFEFASEVVDVVGTKWTSIKENYCPRIEWK